MSGRDNSGFLGEGGGEPKWREGGASSYKGRGLILLCDFPMSSAYENDASKLSARLAELDKDSSKRISTLVQQV